MGCSATSFVLADIDAALSGIPAHRLPEGWQRAVQKCRDGRALCLESPDGVVVATVVPVDNSPDLFECFVILAVGRHPGAFIRQEPALLTIAADLGCHQLAFGTGRRGWSRLLRPPWTPRGTRQFVRPVDVDR